MKQDRPTGPLRLSQRGLPGPEPHDAWLAGDLLNLDGPCGSGSSRIRGGLGQREAAERDRRTQQGELKGGKIHRVTKGGRGSRARPIRRA